MDSNGPVVIVNKSFRTDNARHHRPRGVVCLYRQFSGAQARTIVDMKIHVIHETGVGIIIGFIFGFFVWLIKDVTDY